MIPKTLRPTRLGEINPPRLAPSESLGNQPSRSLHLALLPLLALLLGWELSAASYQATSGTVPPAVMREFRAAWIPTVGNSCWPSKSGLTTAQQQAELIALLDRAAELKLNAVIFQVRPACDALYKSDIEPWSEYLTGTQGKAPEPYYDPLEFAVTEAHKRGLELHAWFNPYRARHFNAKSPVAPNHVSRMHPGLARTYGRYLWLDPGERDVQDYSLRVVLDVVKRYDVDAVHFDDYFYPYEEKDSAGRILDFPDDASWQKTGVNSGLSRPDWRRRNVDTFIQRVNQAVHAEKPWVKFGLSPFGIWRPGHPPTIKGYDPYEKLYADARKWLVEGWCDYMAPQLYWAIQPPAQSFPVLLKWWAEQSPKRRHVWPGINSLKVGEGWQAGEITAQIELTRKLTRAPGHIHWSQSALMKNAGLRQALEREAYRQPALIPRFTWLDTSAPARPAASVVATASAAQLNWSATGTEKPWLWVVQAKQFGDWKTQVLPATQTSLRFGHKPEFIAVSAVDRCGNQSPVTVLKLAR
jgi:uncharacterized lipoprotein YddW (UPF0748 family)